MDALWESVNFATKGLVVLVIFYACALVVFQLFRRRRPEIGTFALKPVNLRVAELTDHLRRSILPKAEYKLAHKETRRRRRESRGHPSLFVIDFKGDVAATQVAALREEITALLQIATPRDEVAIRLESAGGMVTHYGLAASQLARLKQHQLRVTACIDRVAASGGYLMACVADQILAAPFAVVGSIGVAAPVPNLHRWLKDHGVDFEEFTAGEHKRTVTLLGEITSKGRQKFQEQLEETHRLFKAFVAQYRPALDLDRVATGEYWHGERAKELGLVDALATSDDYLLSKLESHRVFELTFIAPHNLRERLAGTMTEAAAKGLLRLWSHGEALRFP